MDAEFDTAVEDGKALSFAIGCLLAAWREMPMQWEGRFTLTSYAVALGLIIPMSALQVVTALVGYSHLLPGPGNLQSNLFVGAYQAAIPSLMVLLLLLGIGHLVIAWQLLERRWRLVALLWAFNAAVSVTLGLMVAALFLDGGLVAHPLIALAAELAIVPALAWWQAQLPIPSPAFEDG